MKRHRPRTKSAAVIKAENWQRAMNALSQWLYQRDASPQVVAVIRDLAEDTPLDYVFAYVAESIGDYDVPPPMAEDVGLDPIESEELETLVAAAWSGWHTHAKGSAALAWKEMRRRQIIRARDLVWATAGVVTSATSGEVPQAHAFEWITYYLIEHDIDLFTFHPHQAVALAKRAIMSWDQYRSEEVLAARPVA